jgi:hypothetical protein
MMIRWLNLDKNIETKIVNWIPKNGMLKYSGIKFIIDIKIAEMSWRGEQLLVWDVEMEEFYQNDLLAWCSV